MKRRKKIQESSPEASTSLQALLDDPSLAEVVWENQGQSNVSVRIDRTVKLRLSGTVLLGVQSPAIMVTSRGKAVIRGGYVATSLTDKSAIATGSLANSNDWRNSSAIEIEGGGSVELDGVELLGDVRGACAAGGEWHLPSSLFIEVPARTRCAVAVKGHVPTVVQIQSEIHNVEPTLQRVGPGPVDFSIDIDAREFESGVILDGWLRFEGEGAIRRIRLRARLISASSVMRIGTLTWTAQAWSVAPTLSAPLAIVEPSTPPILPDPPILVKQKSAAISPIFRSPAVGLSQDSQSPSPQESPTDQSSPVSEQQLSSKISGRVPPGLSPIFKELPMSKPSSSVTTDASNKTSLPHAEPSAEAPLINQAILCPCGCGVAPDLCNRGKCKRQIQGGISNIFRKEPPADTRSPDGPELNGS